MFLPQLFIELLIQLQVPQFPVLHQKSLQLELSLPPSLHLEVILHLRPLGIDVFNWLSLHHYGFSGVINKCHLFLLQHIRPSLRLLLKTILIVLLLITLRYLFSALLLEVILVLWLFYKRFFYSRILLHNWFFNPWLNWFLYWFFNPWFLNWFFNPRFLFKLLIHINILTYIVLNLWFVNDIFTYILFYFFLDFPTLLPDFWRNFFFHYAFNLFNFFNLFLVHLCFSLLRLLIINFLYVAILKRFWFWFSYRYFSSFSFFIEGIPNRISIWFNDLSIKLFSLDF